MRRNLIANFKPVIVSLDFLQVNILASKPRKENECDIAIQWEGFIRFFTFYKYVVRTIQRLSPSTQYCKAGLGYIAVT